MHDMDNIHFLEILSIRTPAIGVKNKRGKNITDRTVENIKLDFVRCSVYRAKVNCKMLLLVIVIVLITTNVEKFLFFNNVKKFVVWVIHFLLNI